MSDFKTKKGEFNYTGNINTLVQIKVDCFINGKKVNPDVDRDWETYSCL